MFLAIGIASHEQAKEARGVYVARMWNIFAYQA